MSRKIAFTVFILLMAFFPLATLLAANPHLLREPTEELFLIAGASLGLFALVEALYLVSDRERVVVLLFFGLFLMFLWKPILEWVGSQGVKGLAAYWGTALLAFGLAFWGTRSRDFRSVLAFGLAAYAAFPVVQVVIESQRSAPERTERLAVRDATVELVEGLPEPRTRPDIYLLIFDCTTSPDMFLEQIFDGSEEARRRVREFLGRMQKLGFENPSDSWSNYERTDPSLFSLFNFVYHDGASGFQWYQKYFGFRQSALRLYLSRNGYRIVSAKKDIPCPEEFDACYPVRNQLELVSLLVSSTPLLDVLFKLDKYVFTPLGSNALRGLTASLKTAKLSEIDDFISYVEKSEPADKPTFVYAHFQASHPVNFYDANCETESIALFEQRSGDDRVEDFSLARYGSEYLCFLKKIVAVTQAIRKRDPDAWILVLSDHGFGAQRWGIRWEGPVEREKLDEMFRVLNFVRTSPACARELASVKSNVNKSRALVNCLTGEESLPYLPDQVDLQFLGKDAAFTIEPDGYR